MNYRHAFHAGNFADVMKHACLTLALLHLANKPKPLFYLDTHAGAGTTPLDDPRLMKTAEFQQGIGKLLARRDNDLSNEITPYLDAVRPVCARSDKPFYPGSPWLARRLMKSEGREQDRFVFAERHPDEASELNALFGGDRRVRVLEGDGYAALRSLLPPPERRGLVLIDPPFEQRDEWQSLVEAMNQSLARWRTGSFLIWYPLKDPSVSEEMLAAIKALDPPESLVLELQVRALDGSTMSGSGLLAVNPPWGLVEKAPALLEWLAEALAQGKGAKARVEPLDQI